MPSPSIQVEKDKYLISFVHPGDSRIYVFSQNLADSSLSTVEMLAITLPATFASSEFRIGFTDGYIAIISRLKGQWWASCVRLSTGIT